MEFEIVSSLKNGYNFYYTIKIPNGCNIFVNVNPFGNCQSWSIGYLKFLIQYLEKENKLNEINDVLEKLDALCEIGKPLVVVDLNTIYYNKIKGYLNFIFCNHYKSSNDSDMVMCVIDTRR